MIEALLSQAFTQSAIALTSRLKQDDDQQTFSATYLGYSKVQLSTGDIRTAYNQGTRQVAVGESVTVTFPRHAHSGQFTSKIS